MKTSRFSFKIFATNITFFFKISRQNQHFSSKSHVKNVTFFFQHITLKTPSLLQISYSTQYAYLSKYNIQNIPCFSKHHPQNSTFSSKYHTKNIMFFSRINIRTSSFLQNITLKTSRLQIKCFLTKNVKFSYENHVIRHVFSKKI